MEKAFCKISKNKDLESKAESITCQEMEKIDPSITDAVCTKYFEEGWSDLAAKCPSSMFEANTSPADIEKWLEQEFCSHASDTSMENVFATRICTLGNKADPQIPVPVCEMAFKKSWEDLAAKCPKPLMSSPIDVLQKAFCMISKNKDLESKAESITCQEVEKIDPSITDAVCTKFFEEGWSDLAAKCPSSMFEANPSPADIAKWVEQEFCSHASDTSMENEFATVACTIGNKAVPQVPVAICEMALKKGWEELATECPKPLADSPIDIMEKAFCKISKNKDLESKAESITCQELEKIEPSVTDAVCKKFFEEGWSTLASKCPSEAILIDPSPADIAKWLEEEFCSHAGEKEREDEFITTICTLANKEVPQVPVSACEMALKEGWSQLAAQCPATTTAPADVLIV
jgi:hypothetical protein